MKLINKTQRIYLGLVVVLLLVWSVVFVVAIYSAIETNIDETLRSELRAQIDELNTKNTMQEIATPQMEITSIPAVIDTTVALSDTTLFNSVEQEDFPYRQASTQIQVAGQAYQFTMRRSTVEYDDLFETILVMELIFVLLLLGGLFIINKKILRRLWHPFYHTLKQVNHYNIGQPEKLNWGETDIDEFQQLNQVLQDMIQQIERDYQSLKQFTENAAHEIQTPLAVITTRIERLLQDENFTETQWRSLHELHQATTRLSRLKRALLLLTKIENRQFNNYKSVEVSSLLQDLISEYQDEIDRKKLQLTKDIQNNITLKVNPELFELLIRNLFTNALKHNLREGKLHISLSRSALAISNTGAPPQEDTSHYFERFYKKNNDSTSLGLGLSIVKEICILHDFKYSYSFEKDWHTVNIEF